MAIVEIKIEVVDGAYQFNQLVLLDRKVDDEFFQYGVQITTEQGGHGDFVGLYNLDGDQLNESPMSWSLVEGDEIGEVPPHVLSAFESWEA